MKIVTALAISVIAVVSVFSLFLGYTYIQNNQITKGPLLTVVGEGKVDAAPELVSFTVTFVSSAKTTTDALSGEKTKRQDLITLLSGTYGIDTKDIQVSYPKVSPVGTTIDNLVYQTSTNMDIKLRKLSNFDNLVSKLYLRGDASISNIIFTTNNPREIEDKAITNAFEDGKARADKMALAAGKKLGKLVSVTGQQTQAVGALTTAASLAPSASASATSGSIELTRNITLVYELQ